MARQISFIGAASKRSSRPHDVNNVPTPRQINRYAIRVKQLPPQVQADNDIRNWTRSRVNDS